MKTIFTRRKALATGSTFGLTFVGGLSGLSNFALAQDAANTPVPTTVPTDIPTDAPMAGLDTRAYVMGDPDAPVHVIEYASLTCPHCARFETDVLPRLREEYIDTGKIKFELREVYFDRLGLWGGMLARCDGGSRYFGIIRLLLERQTDWSRASSGEEAITSMRRIGLEAGLSEEQMDECLQDAALAEALVAQYQVHMEEYEIGGTPSFVIDGELNSNMGYDDFAAKLDEALG